MSDDLTEIKADIKQLKVDVRDLVARAQYKKELKADILTWLRIGGGVLSILIILVGYISYETGLNKPMPQQTEQK